MRMLRRVSLTCAVCVAASAIAWERDARAEDVTGAPEQVGNDLAEAIDDVAYPIILGTGLYLWGRDGRQGLSDYSTALLTAVGASELLKHVIHSERPNHADDQSFPSGHATTAFATASVASYYHPDQSVLFYGLATAIAWSRVERNEHHFRDVLVGAALGLAIGQSATRQRSYLPVLRVEF